MKKFIRDMIDDLQRKKDKDFVPNIPAGLNGGKMTQFEPQPGDLENQELSKDPLERVRQLDFQAQQDEERETS